jgi:hypothetical protein
MACTRETTCLSPPLCHAFSRQYVMEQWLLLAVLHERDMSGARSRIVIRLGSFHVALYLFARPDDARVPASRTPAPNSNKSLRVREQPSRSASTALRLRVMQHGDVAPAGRAGGASRVAIMLEAGAAFATSRSRTEGYSRVAYPLKSGG